MNTIIISILLLSLGLGGLCIKILLQKNGRFSGTCASNNPFLNKNGEKCSYCGAETADQCKKEANPGEK